MLGFAPLSDTPLSGLPGVFVSPRPPGLGRRLVVDRNALARVLDQDSIARVLDAAPGSLDRILAVPGSGAGSGLVLPRPAFMRTITDTAAVSDQAAAGLEMDRTAADTASVSDAVVVSRELERVVSDSVSHTDSVAAELSDPIGTILGPNRVAHWDFSDAGSLTIPDATISQIADLSGNGWNQIRDGVTGPALDASTFALPAGRFNGGASGKMSTAVGTLATDDFWVLLVSGLALITQTGYATAVQDDTNKFAFKNVHSVLLAGTVGGDPVLAETYATAGAALAQTSNGLSASTLHLVKARLSPALRSAKLDGGPTATNSTIRSLTGLDAFRLGSNNKSTTFALNGWVGEAVWALGSTPEADIDAVAAILATKWATP